MQERRDLVETVAPIGSAGRWPAAMWVAGQRPALPVKVTRPTVGGYPL